MVLGLGKKETILETLYQGCSIGSYGVLEGTASIFTGIANTAVTVQVLPIKAIKDLNTLFPQCKDFGKE